MKEKFLKLYKEAIDEKGNVKACGRAVCKELIITANIIDNTTDYGNSETGFMNTDNLMKLYSSIHK